MIEMGSHWVLLLLYLNWVLSWPEDGRSRPKHVAKYYLIVIIASCLMYIVYWRCIIYFTKQNIMDLWLTHFNTSSHIRWKSNILSPIIKSYQWFLFKKCKAPNLSLKCKNHSNDDWENCIKFVIWSSPL